MHLIGRKVIERRGIFKEGKFENDKSNKSFFGPLCLHFFGSLSIRVCPLGRGMFHVTEAGHANLSAVSSAQRREAAIAKGRATRPKQSHCHPRRPFAHSLDHLRRLKQNQGRRKPSVSSLWTSRTIRAPNRSQLRSEVRSLHPHR